MLQSIILLIPPIKKIASKWVRSSLGHGQEMRHGDSPECFDIANVKRPIISWHQPFANRPQELPSGEAVPEAVVPDISHPTMPATRPQYQSLVGAVVLQWVISTLGSHDFALSGLSPRAELRGIFYAVRTRASLSGPATSIEGGFSQTVVFRSPH